MVQSENDNLQQRLRSVAQTATMEIKGQVAKLTGLTVEVVDFAAPVGAQCVIITRTGKILPAEVIGFRSEVAVLMPLAAMDGIASGDWVRCLASQPTVPLGPELLGRVINGAGEPIDDRGPLLCQTRRSIHAHRIQPLHRSRIDSPIATGIRSVDALMTCGSGQRMGIFSGPGVGKSVLLGMISRNTAADVTVIALIGERGREVREFIEKDLGPEGLKHSVVVVSTSDEPAPLRVRAGFVATAVADYFRNYDQNVMLLLDSVTRIAMAQRQIGLALAEPPATRGYTPSVFALLPTLVERCGRAARGSITGFFTVLVEGDDLTEPISDAMRGLLDGHLWLSRDLANRGHYPAVDILESISRIMVDVVDDDHLRRARYIARLVALYRDIEDLVNIGAYAAGSNAQFDLAIQAKPHIDKFLQQAIGEKITFDDTRRELAQLVQSLQTEKLNPASSTTPSNAAKPDTKQSPRPSPLATSAQPYPNNQAMKAVI